MTKTKKNSLSAARNTSTLLMNQIDTNSLRALRIAGWAFVGLVDVDELLCFRILQLLHTPCAACYKSLLLLCGHLCDPVVHLHPRLIRVSTSFRFGFIPLSSHCRSVPYLRSRRLQVCCSSHPSLVNGLDKENLFWKLSNMVLQFFLQSFQSILWALY